MMTHSYQLSQHAFILKWKYIAANLGRRKMNEHYDYWCNEQAACGLWIAITVRATKLFP